MFLMSELLRAGAANNHEFSLVGTWLCRFPALDVNSERLTKEIVMAKLFALEYDRTAVKPARNRDPV